MPTAGKCARCARMGASNGPAGTCSSANYLSANLLACRKRTTTSGASTLVLFGLGRFETENSIAKEAAGADAPRCARLWLRAAHPRAAKTEKVLPINRSKMLPLLPAGQAGGGAGGGGAGRPPAPAGG